MALAKHCRHSRSAWSRCGCSWYFDGRANGRRFYVNVGPDRAEAERLAARAEADRKEGRAAPVRRDHRLVAVRDRWLARLEALGRRPQTIRAYKTASRAALEFFGDDADVAGIRAADVGEFVELAYQRSKGHGGEMLERALRGILGQAHREGLIEAVPSPPRDRRSITPNPDVRMSSAEAVATIAELPEGLWRDLGEFIVLTGLRIGEALALRWADVDEGRGVLTVVHSAEQRGRLDAPVKTSTSARRVRLEPAALAILARQPRTDPRVFPRRYEAARRAIVGAMQRAGTYRSQRGFHSLRHANAELRNRAGQSLRDAAASLGHGPNFAMSLAYGWHAEDAEPPRLADVLAGAPAGAQDATGGPAEG
jgi:integrase